MRTERGGSLKKTYLRNFLGLVVIPILLILGVALSAISLMVHRTAIEGMESDQSQIVSTLKTETQNLSIQLSHFVSANNDTAMGIAAGLDTDDFSARYAAESKLSEAFQAFISPDSRLLSAMFCLKSGRSAYLKDTILIPMKDLRGSGWYRAALAHPGSVQLGGYNTALFSLTYSSGSRGELVLVAALSPDAFIDRSGKVETVALFVTSGAGAVIRNAQARSGAACTAILDPGSKVLFGYPQKPDVSSVLSQIGDLRPGVFEKSLRIGGVRKKYTYLISEEPYTKWKVFTAVPTGELTGNLWRIMAPALLVIVGVLALFFLFSNYFLKNIIDPVHSMVDGLRRLEEGDLDTRVEPAGHREIRDMIHTFNHMVQHLKTSIQAEEAERQEKHEAEMRALQSQINPHFLVNSLNSIRFMAQVSKYDSIRRMAEAIIKILTCSFRSSSSLYTVREELDVLDSFIYLMKIRYSNGFDVAYHVDKACLDLRMPRLVLQPIVENSIVHGFRDTGEDIGHLQISVHRDEKFLYLEVEDDGSGMTEEEIRRVLSSGENEEKSGGHIGISNVSTRLRLRYGGLFSMKMESRPGEYTKTILRIPARSGGGEANEQSPDRGR